MICLTVASWPWPRKATHGCFHVFAWNQTKSDRHVFRRMLLNPKKKIVPTTDYQVLTKKMKDFVEKSKVTILTYINMISYEYEYFGSARTPATKSSTRDHTASLFCFIQRTTSVYVLYESHKKYEQTQERYVVNQATCCCAYCYRPYTTARIIENE